MPENTRRRRGARQAGRPGGSKHAQPLRHFLIAVPAAGRWLHAFVVCNGDQAIINRVVNYLIDHAEKTGTATPMTGMILQTQLDNNPEIIGKVTALIDRVCPESTPLRHSMTDFHLVAWEMPEDDPDNAWLMKIH